MRILWFERLEGALCVLRIPTPPILLCCWEEGNGIRRGRDWVEKFRGVWERELERESDWVRDKELEGDVMSMGKVGKDESG